MKRVLLLVALCALGCKKDLGPLPATHLAIRQQPSGAVTGQLLSTQPIVEVRNDDEQVVTSGNWGVSVTGQAVIYNDTIPLPTIDGVAAFSHLRVDVSATGPMLLIFSAPGLQPVASNTFVASK